MWCRCWRHLWDHNAQPQYHCLLVDVGCSRDVRVIRRLNPHWLWMICIERINCLHIQFSQRIPMLEVYIFFFCSNNVIIAAVAAASTTVYELAIHAQTLWIPFCILVGVFGASHAYMRISSNLSTYILLYICVCANLRVWIWDHIRKVFVLCFCTHWRSFRFAFYILFSSRITFMYELNDYGMRPICVCYTILVFISSVECRYSCMLPRTHTHAHIQRWNGLFAYAREKETN